MTQIDTIVSGIQPSGRPHIGNYFGAMKRHISLQDQYEDVFFFIAEYHALTSTKDKKDLEENIYNLAVDYLTLGLDPDKVCFYRQRDVPELFELAWIFNCLTTVPFLQRAHAYKSKTDSGETPSAGLLTYPVLQAADILIVGADGVPVGEDQRQHIEYTREIARKFNTTYEPIFSEPEAIMDEETGVIPGIDGRKMSKSYGNDIPLFADKKTLENKVMAIETDSKPINEPKNPEEDLVFQYHKLFTAKDQLTKIRNGYEQGGLSHSKSKEFLLENMENTIVPLREKREEVAANNEYVLDVLKNGAEKIKPKVKETIERVRDAVGVN